MKRMTTLVPAIPCQARERVSLAFILLIILFLSGCKTSKKVGTVASGSAKAHNEFFESMEEHSFQFNTMTARLNAELKTAKNNMSSRVDLKMVRDSAFQLSVQPFLGIEVFRAEFTVDSIKVVDRMNKRYVAERYADLKGQTPIEPPGTVHQPYLPARQTGDRPQTVQTFQTEPGRFDCRDQGQRHDGTALHLLCRRRREVAFHLYHRPVRAICPAMGLFRFPRDGRTAFPDADGRTGPGKRFVAGRHRFPFLPHPDECSG